MKTRLAILSAAVVGPLLLSACGEEAPPIVGTGDQNSTETDDMMDTPTMGTLLPPPSPQPGIAPGAGGTPAISPGDTETPGISPGITPGTGVTPGTMVTPAPADPSRPPPLMPPVGGTAAPPATATAAPPATTPPAVTPTPATPTPTEPAEPEAAMCEAAWTVGSSGFVSAPGSGGTCFQGYAWASATPEGDSMIVTGGGSEDFSDCGADCMLCVSGTVAPTDDFSGVALLGLNLNQQQSSNSPDDISVTGSITVNVSNAGGSPLRVQLSGSKDWCKEITGESGDITIQASEFVTECWEGGTQTEYDGEPVEALMLLVPGSDTDATDFDICLNSVTPG